jgi:hypothetical protein
MPRRVSRLTSLVAVAAITVLLTGCFSIESSFSVNDDGTADVTYRILVDVEQLEQLSSMMGEELGDMGGLSGDALIDEMMGGDDPCGDLESDLGDYDVSSTEIRDGGEVGVECTVSGVALEDINSSMASEDGSTFVLEQDDAGTRFTATLAGIDELTGAESDEMTEMLDMSFEDLFSIVFTVSAPGSLGDNNATSTDGASASWAITPDADFVVDGAAQMNAEWSPGDSGSSSSTLWIILGIVAAVVVIGLIVFLVMRNKKSGGDGGATTGPAPVPSGDAPPTSPMAPPTTPGPTAPATPPATPPPPPAAPPSAAPPPPPPVTDVPPPPPAAPPAAPPPPPPS